MKRLISTRRLFFVTNTKGISLNKSFILNGNLVLRAKEKGLVSKEALEAARKAIKKVIKKSGQIIIRANAFLPLTSKPSEVRMGKGKGKSVFLCLSS
jgi:large subunit ribosomal protein L16